MFAVGYQTVAFLSLLLYSLVLIRISMDVTAPRDVFDLDEKGLQAPNRVTIELSKMVKPQRRDPIKANSKPPTSRRPRETKKTEKTTSESPKKKKVSLSELASRVGSHVHSDEEESQEKDETYQEETPQKNVRGTDDDAGDQLSTGGHDDENENENDNEANQEEEAPSETSEDAVDESAAAENVNENEHALKGDDDLEEEDEVTDDADNEAEAAKRDAHDSEQGATIEEETEEVEEEQKKIEKKDEEETEQDEEEEEDENEGQMKPQNAEVEEPVEIVHDAYKSQTDSAKKSRPTHWRKYFESTLCKKFRHLPPGHKADRNVGQGIRSLCYRDASEKKTVEYRTEIGGSIDISFQYKAIYIPVMKAGSQMFQEVFRRRLKGKRIYDRELHYYLKKYDLKLEDFFIFTFVRNPFSTFVSAYGEVSKYTARNRTQVKGFSSIEDRPENEPKRALAALEDIKKGTFHGLVPAHMYTQTWKISRCMADRALTDIPINFVGHLENLDADWKYVERQLKLSHQSLPVIHSSGPKRQLPFDAPSKAGRFSALTREVCDYYKADFVCFGYDDSICNQ